MDTNTFLDILVRTAARTLPHCDHDKHRAARAAQNALDEAHSSMAQKTFFDLRDALGSQADVIRAIVDRLQAVPFSGLDIGAAFCWPESPFAAELVHLKARAGTLGTGDASYCNYTYSDPNYGEVIGRMDDETLVIPVEWPGPWRMCASCNNIMPPSLLAEQQMQYEDEQDSILEIKTVRVCRDQVGCGERRAAFERMACEAARTDDMAAREEGRGGRIGGGF